ncbi:MAG: hypothetical protein SGILL_010414 [Bacillariaceae sp.]
MMANHLGFVPLYQQFQNRGIVEPGLATVLGRVCRDHVRTIDGASFVQSIQLIPSLEWNSAMDLLCALRNYEHPVSALDHESLEVVEAFRKRCVEAAYTHFLTDVPLFNIGTALSRHGTYDSYMLLAERALKDAGIEDCPCYDPSSKDLSQWLSLRYPPASAVLSGSPKQQFVAALKEAKMAKAALVPFHIRFPQSINPKYTGTYCKKTGEEFYAKVGCDSFSTTAIIGPSKCGDGWEIFGEGGELEFVNPNQSEYEGSPPFNGWKSLHDCKGVPVITF